MTRAIFVPGVPKGQPRPRAFARNGRARVYDPGTAEHWKSEIALACRDWRDARISGPVNVRLVFDMPRPLAHYGKHGSVREGAPFHHTSKPDADNLAKAVLDTMTTIGVWHDDDQVAELSTVKRYAEQPGCHIAITEMT